MSGISPAGALPPALPPSMGMPPGMDMSGVSGGGGAAAPGTTSPVTTTPTSAPATSQAAIGVEQLVPVLQGLVTVLTSLVGVLQAQLGASTITSGGGGGATGAPDDCGPPPAVPMGAPPAQQTTPITAATPATPTTAAPVQHHTFAESNAALQALASGKTDTQLAAQLNTPAGRAQIDTIIKDVAVASPTATAAWQSLMSMKVPVRYVSDAELKALGGDSNVAAMYLPNSNQMAVSASALQRVDVRELTAAIAHEVTHAADDVSGRMEGTRRAAYNEIVAASGSAFVNSAAGKERGALMIHLATEAHAYQVTAKVDQELGMNPAAVIAMGDHDRMPGFTATGALASFSEALATLGNPNSRYGETYSKGAAPLTASEIAALQAVYGG